MIIAVDFDGTIVKHDFPRIGEEVPRAIASLKLLVAEGNSLILWTMRSGEFLEEAVSYLRDAGVELWGVNGNPGQHSWSESPKAYANHYIDDAAIGCPLIVEEGTRRPYVDWVEVMRHLYTLGVISEPYWP